MPVPVPAPVPVLTPAVQCPNEKCRNDQAYWYQLQIRSADEPMTAFYKCTKCAKEWRE